MDEDIQVIGEEQVTIPSILCTTDDPGRSFQVNSAGYPLRLSKLESGEIRLKGTISLYGGDQETKVVERFFRYRGEKPIFKGIGNAASLPKHHPLNLPNTPADVRLRQEVVRELVANEELYRRVESIIGEQLLFQGISRGRVKWGDEGEEKIDVLWTQRMDETSRLLENLVQLEDLGLQSQGLQKAVTWAQGVLDNTITRELVERKRQVTDSRLFAVYTERHAGVRLGLLKPGIKPEEVFDFLHPLTTSYTIEGDGGKNRTRALVSYESGLDAGLIQEAVVGRARQRMDVLNQLSTKWLGVPLYILLAQLKHAYQGAYMFRYLQEKGCPLVFPEIVDDPRVLELEGVEPMRLAFEHSYYSPENFMPNDLNLSGVGLAQIEGPNKRGKSEAWRTVNLAHYLTNAGWPILARGARMGIVPHSSILSFKGSSGHGGSELERTLNGVNWFFRHHYIAGQTVILDEFGDLTNGPTAREIASRLLPVLQERGSKVLITSHHGALTDYVLENGGKVYIPDPEGEGPGRYRLVPKNVDEVDYRSGEVLDELEFTAGGMTSLTDRKQRLCPKKKELPFDDDESGEMPF